MIEKELEEKRGLGKEGGWETVVIIKGINDKSVKQGPGQGRSRRKGCFREGCRNQNQQNLEIG